MVQFLQVTGPKYLTIIFSFSSELTCEYCHSLANFYLPTVRLAAGGGECAVSRQICSVSRVSRGVTQVSRRYADTVFIDSITTIAASIFSHPSIDKHLVAGIYRLELETKVHPKIRNHGEGPY